jgi:threonine dehydrogenase-like Zn-dependent dehydrogenase
MRALSVIPRTAGSARVERVAGPAGEDGDVLVRTVAVGICGTDREILRGAYGTAPAQRERLILGHESIGRVVEAPSESTLRAGDWVVGVVRRPDPVPCTSCAVGEWDMCRNGRYRERGIKALDGFACDYYRSEPAFLVRSDPGLAELGVLVEPASVIAKAWEHVERIGMRASWRPRRLLVTGAGPIGLLAALFGVRRRLEVHVLDRVSDGPKPELARALGATYHAEGLARAGHGWDIVFECTGAGQLLFQAMRAAAPDGIVCLTGVSSGGRSLTIDAADLNRETVLENHVVFGSVNANVRHYQQAIATLADSDRAWLASLITRREPIENWEEALTLRTDDVKTVLAFD